MPSMRRMRLLLVAGIAVAIVILVYTSGMQPDHDMQLRDFYQKTKDAIDRGTSRGGAGGGRVVIDTKTGGKTGHVLADKDGDGDIDEDDRRAGESLQQRLQAVAKEAKDKANEKAGLKPDVPSRIVGVGSSAEGQQKADKAPGGPAKGADAPPFPTTEKEKAKVKGDAKQTNEQREAEAELNMILKRSPVIIFSKSNCPYSSRAKAMLLEKYAITPKPYVVELDHHELGPQLQDYLEAKTGQRTVPNIMVNGVSIGDSEMIVKLDKVGELAPKIEDLGQRRVEVQERFSAGSHQRT